MTTVENSCGPTDTPVDVDIPALREKYRVERERRIRPEGARQYQELKGEFAEFAEVDPHTPLTPRAPISSDVEVVVLGGGIAGLLAGSYLKKAGVEDVRIIEMGGDVGGVWYWNRFPGIQCDNDAYCYVPLLEELDFVPSKKFADGAEIFEHCRRIAKHFGLYDGALFSTQVRTVRWDETIDRWQLTTNRGDDIRARFVVMAQGSYNRPKLPGIPGILDYVNAGGHTFHSARWDYDYTGGDANGGLDKLRDKRVALVGTGATGVQLVPHLGRDAKHVYVFQRTPSSVDDRDNTPTDPEWVKSLQPGWQEERKRNFHNWSPFVGVVFGAPDLVCDFWTELGRNMSARIATSEDPAALDIEQIMAIREEEDYKLMERLRRRISSAVADPDTAEALKPYYRFMCKRPCSSEEYLATFNRPNVTLVDVAESKGVDRLTERGIVANGVEYEVDCVIFASGFEISTEISRRYAIDVVEGRDGLSLFDYWQDSYQTLHGITTRGFPNQFFTGFIQGGVSANTTAMFEQQAKHIAYIIAEAISRGAKTVEPSQEGQDTWVKTVRDLSIDNSAFELSCTPGYYNNEGRGGGEANGAFLGDFYSPGFYEFDDLLAAWRAKGDLDGLELGQGERSDGGSRQGERSDGCSRQGERSDGCSRQGERSDGCSSK